METWQAILLGMMIAWSPALLVLAVLLLRSMERGKNGTHLR